MGQTILETSYYPTDRGELFASPSRQPGKIDFEKLEMHSKNSSHLSDSKICKNCKTLESKIHYLVRTVDKLSNGKSNFETVLASQKCIFGKTGLGFHPQKKKNGISKPVPSG